MKKIVLVDGSSYLFRAFHALPLLANNNGEYTNAILGVVNMIKKIPEKYNTDYVAIIFDAKGKNFRHKIYSEYKANRKKMPDELGQQIQPLHQIIKNMGYPLISIENVEADDVMGSFANSLSLQGHQVILATSDKDMAQLVNSNVTLIDTMKDNITDIEGVKAKFGVYPEQIIDYLALVGDSVDNIPGIANVGPKTAEKWLTKYKNIENLIVNADEIKGKVGENLRNSIEVLKMSYKLATIKCDLDLPYSLEDLKLKDANNDYLREIFTDYQLKSLLKDLPKLEEKQNNIIKNYKTILSENDFNDLCNILSNAKEFCFDTETNSLNINEANVVGISFSIKENEAYYIPLQHNYLGVEQQLDLKNVIEKLKTIFANENIIKIAHNFKYDEKILSKYDVKILGNISDTMIMSYVLQSNGKHNMDFLANKYLGENTISYEDVVGKGRAKKTLDEIDIETVSKYACEDADITFRLYKYFEKELKKESKLFNLYKDLELPLMLILNEMEKYGVKIDSQDLYNQSLEVSKKIEEAQNKCFEICEQKFNLSSPVQLRKVLFEDLGLPIIKKTSKGEASTAEEVLVELANEYNIAKYIMEFRHLTKLKNTYIDKLPTILDVNSRVHTSYNQTVTVTGRLSSSEPNLQNIPIKTEQGRKIRQAFIAEKNYKIVAADYSQIELRIMAELSEDKSLIKAFNENLDIHKVTASETLNIDINEVTNEQRRKAKAVNFGLIYGMSAFGLAKQLNISRKEAQDYINIYFNRYPKIKEYMDKSKENAKQNGYVETILGRRLYLPEIKSKNAIKRNMAERAAINAPMQGTAADIIKLAMLNVNKNIITKYPNKIKMIMQVHDELVFEVAEDYVDNICNEIKQQMQNVISLKVPLIVNIDVGNNWEQAH